MIFRRVALVFFTGSTALWGGSLQESTDKSDKQKVNFCGILRTAGNPTSDINVENIGMPSYKNIQVYEKPADAGDPCADPHKSTAELNFKDIEAIKRVTTQRILLEDEKDDIDERPHKRARYDIDSNRCNGIHVFKGRKYVEIEITFNDPEHTQKNFLVEDSRRIVYSEIVDGLLIKHKTNIGALDSLELKGHYDSNDDDKEVPGARCKMILKGEKPEPMAACPPAENPNKKR